MTGQPILLSRKHHGLIKLGSMTTLADFADMHLVPVFRYEFQRFLGHVPLVFVRSESNDWELRALFGVNSGENLFIGPKFGWSGGNIPDYFRHYPFSVGKDDEGEPALGFYEGSERLQEEEGVSLFDDVGDPTPYLQNLRRRIAQRHVSLTAVAELGASLEKRNLLIPWTMDTVQALAEGNVFRVDMKALRKADADWLKGLLGDGGMDIVYSHFLSLGSVRRVLAMSKRRQNESGTTDADLSILAEEDGEFEFNFNQEE
jgi:hypothetical protein